MGIARTALRTARMELVSAARDRQTLIYTVVLPFAMYPLVFWILLQGAAILKGRDEANEVRVGIAGNPSAVAVERVVAALEEPSAEELLHPGPLSTRRLTAPAPEDWPTAIGGANGARDDERVDALLVLSPTEATLVHDGTRSRSSLARDRVVERLEELVETLRLEAITAAGSTPDALHAFRTVARDLASERDLGGYIFSMMMPLMFVFMTVLGAFYPAVDLTAGEKERGTAETTLCLAVPRLGIVLGKVAAVSAAAALAGTLNLAGMAIAAEHLLAGLGEGEVAIQVPWSGVLMALPFCFVFVVSTSALLLAAASTTATFKQGQALLGSVQLVFLMPAIVGILPTMELSLALAPVPVVQTVLAIRECLQAGPGESVELLPLIAVGATQLVYAAGAIALAVWLTSRESLTLAAATRIFRPSTWRSLASAPD